VIGRLVEIISGIDLRTYLKQKIFDPLGMIGIFTQMWRNSI
jgi:CubicO group peptidase (beta-lactamase class C family)